MKTKLKYVDVQETIDEYPGCQYYIFVGERTGGKTYSTLKHVLRQYIQYGEQFVYMRRYKDDVKRALTKNLFDTLTANGEIENITEGWTRVTQTGNEYHLCKTDSDGKVEMDTEPLGYIVDLAEMERFKGREFPWVTTIMFDEFMSRRGYLPNEFNLFINMLSTIIRLRTNVKIIMLGNTVTKDCPYFREMGLKHIYQQLQGTTEIYKYGESTLQVAVTYTAPIAGKGNAKPSDSYFAFDNPALDMVRNGAWYMEIYPHITHQWKPRDVAAEFYVVYPPFVTRGRIVSEDAGTYIVFTPRKRAIPDGAIVYGQTIMPNASIRYGLHNQPDKLSRLIVQLMRAGYAFYATNECGEHIRTFMNWSKSIEIGRYST